MPIRIRRDSPRASVRGSHELEARKPRMRETEDRHELPWNNVLSFHDGAIR